MIVDDRARSLHELLDGFERVAGMFPDPDEAAHAGAILELIRTTPAPCSSAQYHPGHLTASVLLVAPAAGQVLLIHHPTLGRWLQPGGHIDPDDPTISAAAAREVLEETGLSVQLDPGPFDLDVHPIPTRPDRPGHLHFDVRFLARLDGLPAPGGGEGIVARWCPRAVAFELVDDLGLWRMLAKAVAAGWLR